jgi:hypothetical protein
MYLGRRLGWWLSKHFLYFASTGSILAFAVIWGGLIAILIQGLIVWQHPNWILKWVFGFGQGAYISVPNFGLIDESTIPQHAAKKHLLISGAPLAAFIILSIVVEWAYETAGFPPI